MIKKEITVKLKDGLDARASALFVQTAGEFNSRINVEYADKPVNGKSIMGMMSLTVPCGENIYVTASGEDEDAAIKVIENFLSKQ